MNRKQKIITSVTGITLVLLTLLGLTYAYYLTRIEGNTNTNSISVTTADLKIVYDDNNSYINLTNIMPGISASKTFTVSNLGTNDVKYSVGIDQVVNELSRTEDLTYIISCQQWNKEDTNNKTACLDNELGGEYPKINTHILENTIKKDFIQEYIITINYANPDENQSTDMGKTIKGRMQIYSLGSTMDITGSVTNASEGDYIQINSNPKTSEIVEGKYNLVGIEFGNHTLKVCSKSDTLCTNPKLTKTITINKGIDTLVDITSSTITVTEDYRVATIDINVTKTQFTLTESIKKTYYTLGETLMNDSRIIKNETTPTFTSAATSELGMYKAEDDYGESWYFRGAQSYNYVNFAGFTWRIVRINGDESIRLILDGTLDLIKRKNIDGTYNDNVAGTTSSFNSQSKDNAYIGYMYGLTGAEEYNCIIDNNGVKSIDTTYTDEVSCTSANGIWMTGYDTTHMNLNDSTIKKIIDLFYETYIESESNNYHYEQYLADSLFCGDKELAPNTIGESETAYLGYNLNSSYYAGTGRLQYSSGLTFATNMLPTLKCSENALNNYSRYTSKIEMATSTNKGVSINNDLKHPIALLSADEGAFAGNHIKYKNSSYYLANPYNYSVPTEGKYWWTMTPCFGAYSGAFYSNKFQIGCSTYVTYNVGVRPVINLKKEVLVDGGDGTYEKPYTVKLPS